MKLRDGFWVAGWLLCGCGATHTTHTTHEVGAGGETSETSAGGSSAGSGSGSAHPTPITPPPSQGAVTFSVSSISPSPAGKMCPAGAAFTGAIPAVTDPTQALDADTYLNHVIDGEDAATVSCAVIGTSSFTFKGQISMAGRSLSVTDGMIDATNQGTARISLVASQAFSGALASPGPCTVEVEAGGGDTLQIKAGSMWAHFSCSSVENAPTDYCKAEGYFVLENCAQK